jgi:DNA polymerase (family 10)
MDEVKLSNQLREIEHVNSRLSSSSLSLQVLRSIEMNLKPDGTGDMEPASLKELDLVLGSFHSALRRKEDQTERYLAALNHPNVHILGHPRGRIYNFRIGLTADWSRVFDAAASLNKALEIDGFPDRQVLNIELVKLARASGVRISLGTDAHRPQQLAFMELALRSDRSSDSSRTDPQFHVLGKPADVGGKIGASGLTSYQTRVGNVSGGAGLNDGLTEHY